SRPLLFSSWLRSGAETLLSLFDCFASLRFLRRFPSFLWGCQFTTPLRGPAWFVDLAPAGNSQAIRGHVFRDCRTRSDVRAVPDTHGRDQRRSAADENFVPDRRRILVEAVVIAGNRARADIALRSDLRIPQVGEVHGFRAFADGAFFEFDKIADTRTGFQVIVRPQSREGANNHAVIEAALRDHTMWLDGHIVAEDCIGQ